MLGYAVAVRSPPGPLATLARLTPLLYFVDLARCLARHKTKPLPSDVPPDHDPGGTKSDSRPSTSPKSNATSVKLLPLLAIELIERIADHLFALEPPTSGLLADAPMLCTKPAWVDVKGFMQASPELHKMGYVRWIRILTVREPEDWNIISQNLSCIRYCLCALSSDSSTSTCG